jgi:hypothetical protein
MLTFSGLGSYSGLPACLPAQAVPVGRAAKSLMVGKRSLVLPTDESSGVRESNEPPMYPRGGPNV